MLNLKNLLLGLVVIATLSACDDDDIQTTAGTFEVTIETLQSGNTLLASGTTNFLMPGESQTISFHAGQGHYLSLATMLVQTNDLFFAPEDRGIALYQGDGSALTGDVTADFLLWDAGTEVNEEPGVGPNQAPRQAAANTGADENGTVELISNVNDGYTYPANNELIKVTLTHDGGTEFTLTLENISGSSALPSPLAPGVWAVHPGTEMVFTEGETAPTGLEGVAEDGTNQELADILASVTGYSSPLAPGVWAVHNQGTEAFFTSGSADRGEGLEALAEDGAAAPLGESVDRLDGVISSSVFDTPSGSSDPGLAFPGASYTFTFDAQEGDYLNFATMLVETNDLFFALGAGGINLFPAGTALEGDITAQVTLWDAGTEVNEYPGAGNNQPIRGGGDSGPAENGQVRLVDDAFTYPSVSDLIRVTISQRN